MDLVAISRRFDTTPMWDAYTGRKLAAKCQVTAWDSPRRDGLTTIRRTFSMAYEAQLPNRHAVIVGGQVWIIASYFNPDTWEKDVTRKGYVAQLATLGTIATTDEVLSDTGVKSYISRVWVKDAKDIVTTSESQGQYYVYYPSSEPVSEGEFLYIDDRWHIVRNIISGTAGLMIAECNELERDCLVTVAVESHQDWDPVAETYTGGSVNISAILMLWADDYNNKLPSATAEETGDKRLRISSTYAQLITSGAKILLSGEYWTVVSVEGRNNGAVSAAIRRV